MMNIKNINNISKINKIGGKMANIPPSNSTIRWVKVRFRRVKNRDYYLDAHDYGRKYWCFPVITRKN
jgi:hypothetical protein